MKSRIPRFLVRWVASSFGLWLASEILGSNSISIGDKTAYVLVAGLILAVVNTLIRPLVVFLSLPAVLLSVGLFMIVINAFMVLITDWLYSPLEVDGFGPAMMAGAMVGLVQWLIEIIFDNGEEQTK